MDVLWKEYLESKALVEISLEGCQKLTLFFENYFSEYKIVETELHRRKHFEIERLEKINKFMEDLQLEAEEEETKRS